MLSTMTRTAWAADQPERAWGDLPAGFEDSWSVLVEQYPGARVEFRWGRVYQIFGPPIGGGTTPEESVENFLRDHIGLFGVTRDELTLVSLIEPPDGDVGEGEDGEDDGESSPGGPAIATYYQHLDGIPVVNAALTLWMTRDQSHAITFISSTLHPSPAAFLAEKVLSENDAIDEVADLYSNEPVEISSGLPVIVADTATPQHAWAIEATPEEDVTAAKEICISAVDGVVLGERDLVHRFDVAVSGNVDARRSTYDTKPPDCTNPETSLFGVPRTRLVLYSHSSTVSPPYATCTQTNTVYTNSLPPWGDYSGLMCDDLGNYYWTATSYLEYYPTDQSDSTNMVFKMWQGDPNSGGPAPEVKQMSSGSISPPVSPLDFTYDNFFYEPDSAQVINCWNWVIAGRSWVKSRYSSFPEIDQVLHVYSNAGAAAGALYDGRIVVYNGSGSLKDYNMSTVVAHEYGHKLHDIDVYTNGNTTWQEAWADAVSSYVCGTSKIGENLFECVGFGEDPNGGRDIDDDTKPEWAWPVLSANPYQNGRCMSGAYWDLRDSIGDSYSSDSGQRFKAGRMLLHSVLSNPIGVDPGLSAIALAIDDSTSIFGSGDGRDNNHTNGSPNYEAINEAFRRHGLATKNIAYVTMAWVLDLYPPADPPPATSFNATVSTNWNGLTRVSTNPVKLRYRKNGGAWHEANMTDVSSLGDNTLWRATIPANIDSINNVTGDVIDYYARAEVTDTKKRYTSLPTQAQFVFDNYPNNQKPEERDYATLIVSSTAKTTALAADFNGAVTAWDSSLDGTEAAWVHGVPEFVALGHQPAFDYPYDDGTPVTQECFYTGLNKSVSANANWILTSPSFDLSGASAASISYALWFYVRNGKANDDKFVVEIGSGSTWTPIQTISASTTCPTGENCVGAEGVDSPAFAKVRWIRQRIRITSNLSSGQQLRFRAVRHTSSSGTMEACVDDVRITATY
jgi:hypothetical protein